MKIAKIFALQPNVLQCDDSLKLSLSYYAKKKPLQNCKLFCAVMSNVQRLFEALYRFFFIFKLTHLITHHFNN